MFRTAFVLCIVTAAAAQTPSPDTQALQALVTEIRQLRQDMLSTTIVTQRVQVALYRLQTQTALVTRASAQLEAARTAAGNAQSELKRIVAYIPVVEEEARSAGDNAQRKAKEESVAQVKINLERMTSDEQRLRSREIDAETQFRAEQAKLAD